jgi:acetyl-CoA carboxylase biotin carboxyl carrier protein
MKLDVKTIKELAENLEENNIGELTIETKEGKIKLKRGTHEFEHGVVASNLTMPQMMAQMPMQAPAQAAPATPEAPVEDQYEAISSPMVGTFYKSPSPGADAFVKEGDIIKTGQTLCIVEAMKLMNEVKSTINGKIVKVLLKDGEGVKKGDKLFLVEEM